MTTRGTKPAVPYSYLNIRWVRVGKVVRFPYLMTKSNIGSNNAQTDYEQSRPDSFNADGLKDVSTTWHSLLCTHPCRMACNEKIIAFLSEEAVMVQKFLADPKTNKSSQY